MAKATRNTKAEVVDDGESCRRNARHTTVEINETTDEQEIKNESENESGETPAPKATTKRALPGLLSATELRRSKRVKSDNTQYGQVRKEKSGGKVKKYIKLEDDDDDKLASKAISSNIKTTMDLQARKLKSYSQFAAARQSPYPDFARPTPAECKLAHEILASLHGERVRPEAIGQRTTAPSSRAGCGDSASVLDALVRTILSQNTSDANSTRAKLSMDRVYGGSDAWERIVEGGQTKLAKTIESGGLAVVKSKVILNILNQTLERYGAYTLDHLFAASDDDAMREMLAFKGVGPKTASCVLLFCLRRASFAVDTHVHRITGLLGWRPAAATRDQAHAHLDARVPDEDKYGLHVLLVRHGRECEECRAGGKNLGRCALRRAFRKGKMEGKAGVEAREEQEESEVM
ncbi:DNA glycosylase [Xylaria sp. FL1777]|nr:DNA glycosylase [Xylaria sp. FL1777]